MYNRTVCGAFVVIIGFIALVDLGVAYAQVEGPCNIRLRQSAKMLNPHRRRGWCRRSYCRDSSNRASAGRARRQPTLLIGSAKVPIGGRCSQLR